MLEINLHSIARDILEQCEWDQGKAFSLFVKRLESERAARAPIINEAASNILREVAAQQRSQLHRNSARVARADDTSGMVFISDRGFLDKYLLLNSVRLGDATEADLLASIQDHYANEMAAKSRRKFLEAIRQSPKFSKKGKRVRDCFSDREIADLSREYFKC